MNTLLHTEGKGVIIVTFQTAKYIILKDFCISWVHCTTRWTGKAKYWSSMSTVSKLNFTRGVG